MRPKNKHDRLTIGKTKAKRRIQNFLLTEDQDLLEKRLGEHKDTTVLCSCPMCGNPRRHFSEVTIQEKKEIEKERIPD